MEQIIKRLTVLNPWTNVYGLSRSLLALGTLVTLCFNKTYLLFPTMDSKAYLPLPFNDFNQLSLFTICGYENIFVAKVLTALVLLFVISGYLPRISGILHWWVSFSFFVSCPLIDGGDQITSILTLLLVPVTLLDPRTSHWSKYDSQPGKHDVQKLISNFFIFVIKIQVSIVYFQAAFSKFSVEEWSNGTAIYYWFIHNTFGVNEYLEPFILPVITNNFGVAVLTWLVLLFEVLMFSVIFMDKRVQKYFLATAICFHFSILVIHGLMSFFFAMSGALILYLRPVDERFSFKVRMPIFRKSYS